LNLIVINKILFLLNSCDEYQPEKEKPVHRNNLGTLGNQHFIVVGTIVFLVE